MVFSSPIFLFGFLPVALFLYYVSPEKFRNLVLLTTSLVFYAWGEVFYVGIMIISIVANYCIGLLIARPLLFRGETASRYYLVAGVVINLALLISFKYANFITDNLNVLLLSVGASPLDLQPVHLPLGISFFTFQAISYIVDVYRKEVVAQRSLINLALYISLFPQLIAGPIVRYHDVSLQIIKRQHSLELMTSGIERFIIGLFKKNVDCQSDGRICGQGISPIERRFNHATCLAWNCCLQPPNLF